VENLSELHTPTYYYKIFSFSSTLIQRTVKTNYRANLSPVVLQTEAHVMPVANGLSSGFDLERLDGRVADGLGDAVG
jgi:hypothetical protein